MRKKKFDFGFAIALLVLPLVCHAAQDIGCNLLPHYDLRVPKVRSESASDDRGNYQETKMLKCKPLSGHDALSELSNRLI
jgi:hypothetical protein